MSLFVKIFESSNTKGEVVQTAVSCQLGGWLVTKWVEAEDRTKFVKEFSFCGLDDRIVTRTTALRFAKSYLDVLKRG